MSSPDKNEDLLNIIKECQRKVENISKRTTIIESPTKQQKAGICMIDLTSKEDEILMNIEEDDLDRDEESKKQLPKESSPNKN